MVSEKLKLIETPSIRLYDRRGTEKRALNSPDVSIYLFTPFTL